MSEFPEWEPYKLAKVGDRIIYRIVSPVSYECGRFEGTIIKHLGDNEFIVETEGARFTVKQLSPHQFEGGRGKI